MYIYSKNAIFCKKWFLSYGYPMGIVWVSYGEIRQLPGKYQVNTPLKCHFFMAPRMAYNYSRFGSNQSV